MARSGSRCVAMVCGIEASYILDMLIQYLVIALGSALDLCNNQDIVLTPGYNYNLLLLYCISPLLNTLINIILVLHVKNKTVIYHISGKFLGV